MAKPDPFTSWARQLLNQHGVSKSAVARALGHDEPSKINKLANGGRKIQQAEIAPLAAYFGVSPPGVEVLPAAGPQWVPVKVAGGVEAGAFREVDGLNQDEPETLSLPPDPQFPSARQFAVDVFGDSMNNLRPRPILPGDRIVCVSYDDISHRVALRDGMTVVVERTKDDGMYREWSVKQVELYENRAEFHPRSTNPVHKPIIIMRNTSPDDGVTVEIIGLVRRIINDIPIF